MLTKHHLTTVTRSLVALTALPMLLMAPLSANAQPSCKPVNPNSPTDLASDLTNAERIFVRMQGFPELSSEYRVNIDNTVSIPVIGRISVEGITPVCLEAMLAAAASEAAKREVFLTVETVAYKPVYVTGVVSKPGSASWFPGMTVLHATALAGGLYRAPATASAPADTAKVKRLADNQRRLTARLERLRAELAGATKLKMPLEKASSEEMASLFKSEQALLESRNAALANNRATLDRSMSVTREELKGLQQTRERAEEQLRLRRTYRDRLQALQQRGIIPVDRVMEEDLQVAELEQRVTENSVNRARLTATLVGFEREVGGLSLGRQATIGAEISDLERDLAANTYELQGARMAAGVSVATEDERIVSYTIIRGSGPEAARIPAAESDLLRVGDVLVVTVAMQ